MKIDEKLLEEILENSNSYYHVFKDSKIMIFYPKLSSIPKISTIKMVKDNCIFFPYEVQVLILHDNLSLGEVNLDISRSVARRLFKRFKQKILNMEAIEEELKRRKELDFFNKVTENAKKDLSL